MKKAPQRRLRATINRISISPSGGDGGMSVAFEHRPPTPVMFVNCRYESRAFVEKKPKIAAILVENAL
ncbi:MAG: hypothetical protein JO139_03665 [Alphaproteobacteria bacterium]|nr:hypothetical protein [Alphaproteobacteria bacterium]